MLQIKFIEKIKTHNFPRTFSNIFFQKTLLFMR